MLGVAIKSFFAKREGLEPSKIVSVSIMPCTAKKFECAREGIGRDYVPDVDGQDLLGDVLGLDERDQAERRLALRADGLDPENPA